MEAITTHILSILKQRTGALNTIMLIVTPIVFIVGGVIWYNEHIWKPSVMVSSADFVNGMANLVINGKEKILYTGSTQNAGNGWGVRFAGDNNERIELVKNDLTYQTLSIKN